MSQSSLLAVRYTQVINQAVAKVASKAALDEIVSKLVAHKKNHTGQRVRDNHFSVAYRTLNDVRVDISKDALKQRVSRAIPAQSSAKTINNILNSPSSAVSSIKAPTANTDELEVPPLTPQKKKTMILMILQMLDDQKEPPKQRKKARLTYLGVAWMSLLPLWSRVSGRDGRRGGRVWMGTSAVGDVNLRQGHLILFVVAYKFV
jgi:hypothetical protein